MAADLNLEWICSLPRSWTYGITRGGRVFFINEEAKSTTWLHPVTGEAVVTGHRRQSADLPTGWEEAYTFEGARYYINHNERKVTCKHPVTGQPSQDNCIFVVNEQTVATMTSEEKKERPISMINEASNYNMTSDYAVHPMSPVGRTSRASKKVHNFGKRSNSIKRNPNAPVVRRGWLYKQDSTGMKLWKKRWFVLSDLCLFYYRDEKEEGILGSILLPSFQIAMLTSEDHINRKYAFKAAHPNMRTYYFCTDTGKEMELWMKAMLDAALVQTEPVKRVDKITSENAPTKEINNFPNHRVLIKPEVQNNQKNKEISKTEEKKALEAEKYGFQKDGQDRPLTKINSVKLNSLPSEYESGSTCPAQAGHYRPVNVNSSENKIVNVSLADLRGGNHPNTGPLHAEADRVIQRTNSMQQLEQWIKIQKGRGHEEETRGVISYQTLPRNMPSHRAQVMARYPEGYRTLPRNSKTRPESICSVTPSTHDKTLGTGAEEKRRSMRDDTMWQLYEWQQRQFYNKQSTLPRHSTLTSPKTMVNISDQTMHSIPTSPSHGSIAAYQGYSPQRTYRSEVSSPIQRGDVTIDRRHRAHHPKHVYVPDRRSMPAGLTLQSISPQSLQGKTPEELTLLLIKLRRQQAELSSVREHTLAQLMQLKLEAHSPKNEILSHHLQRNTMYLDHQMKENEPIITMVHTMIENSALRPQLYQQLSQDECRGTLYKYRPEEVDIDAKLSRLCEQDKVVHALEEKLQQLHKEKYTLEQALLSASQEIEMNADNPAAIQTVVLQRDDLQNGLLSTCRELSRATAELERAWREYDKLEYDVTVTRNQMQEQLDRLGEVQTESAGIQRAQIQKELWRIQDVMEGLSKHKQQRGTTETGMAGSKPFSTVKYKNEEEEVAPPRPPLPRSYDFTEQPPIIPPLPSDSSSLLCYSRGPVHLPEEKKIHQVQGYPRNGSHCGPDYRLYKSEPELTTVAEVDESNGEEKSEPVSEIETSVKGSHFPVGVVPPRTKSPTPESSTIASYVTLRKTKKMMDSRTERPRSAVDQLCLAESTRPRMTVEEQMERIRRHQQACLREKKKGLNVIGALDQSPLQSPSVLRDNPFRTTQPRRRDDNIKELDTVVRENDVKPNHETPAAEIVQLKEAEPQNMDFSKEFKKTEDIFSKTLFKPEPNGVSSEEMIDKEGNQEKMPEDVSCSPQDETQIINHKAESHPEENIKDNIHEQEETIVSYEQTPEASRESQTMAVKSLSPSPESSASPVPATQPQLTEGSHFMCV
ncbi:pleckstrin homology domain-containing family A member 5 isoform X5 [Canis lupus familiaris]|uniref:pleckstrin homology domain-containing family A member 5 isoform X5 n=1 Tax=Canis lupus familiaris TaxID=9615 RepID=UPI0006B3C2CC|nr:pleckstrin homology domain-containing family A member 5 isoform X5 [Canis lupus familiaris]XP_025311059.1 pleckstrin homology domain-containing family A member 5 isoform X5 [Canis lupus dingo]XP_038294777.1 pleckstrin homology domain-containing family A member 5 isoform X5 [Canis lupus familiaris]XP_038432877.1 pleckstrin homology domain-containing family A member 5 isoform X5 [Canis lupus familiaris]|eukprot:XP_013963892.1 pleckstrin homology domain-containing family A member 5 isoform X26 [Canis lupus familiaris]